MDEEESNISSAIFGTTSPMLEPLIALLKSNRQIPTGIRDMLAQMLDSEGSGYLYFKLILKDTQGKVRNQERDLRTHEIATTHYALVQSGKSANQAAFETGQKFGLDERTVYLRLAEAKALLAWLKNTE